MPRQGIQRLPPALFYPLSQILKEGQTEETRPSCLPTCGQVLLLRQRLLGEVRSYLYLSVPFTQNPKSSLNFCGSDNKSPSKKHFYLNYGKKERKKGVSFISSNLSQIQKDDISPARILYSPLKTG